MIYRSAMYQQYSTINPPQIIINPTYINQLSTTNPPSPSTQKARFLNAPWPCGVKKKTPPAGTSSRSPVCEASNVTSQQQG